MSGERKPANQDQVSIRDNKGRFRPGVSGNPKGGRSGYKQRATDLKIALLEAFDKMGGMDEFIRWGNKADNKKEFYKMVIGSLPKEVTLDGDGLQTKIVLIRSSDKKQPSTIDEERRSAIEAIHE